MKAQAHLPVSIAPEFCRPSSSFVAGLLGKGEEWDTEGMRAQAHLPVHTAPELSFLLSSMVSTETVRLIKDGGRMG